MSPDRRLILFDIDGTLVDTRGAGLLSLQRGFFQAFPHREGMAFPPLDLGGATDSGVAEFLFAHFEIEHTAESRDRFFHCYAEDLESWFLRREDAPGHLLPGVENLLNHLASDERYELALLTGNTQRGAFIKLEKYGIEGFFRTGGFGDDHSDRNRLGPIALRRVEEAHGHAFVAEKTVVIGDTIKDINCARAFGAKVVAVSTGTAEEHVLRDAKPDAVVADFSPLQESLACIEKLF